MSTIQKSVSVIFHNLDSIFDRCHDVPADFTHMLRSCPHLSTYWAGTSLLNHRQKLGAKLQSKLKNITGFVSLLVRGRILLNWIWPVPLRLSLQLKYPIKFMNLENMTFALRGSGHKFYPTWGSMIRDLNNIESSRLCLKRFIFSYLSQAKYVKKKIFLFNL